MVTIKDVAKEAGVGVGTVSRYINGDSSIKTRNRILIDDAIKKLGYQVNLIAKSMKTQRTMTIGVVVHSFTNMFSMKVIENIEKYVSPMGYSVIIAGCGGDSETQYQKILEMKKKMVDGYIIMPASPNADRVKSITGNAPCVLVDRLMDKNVFDSVTIDNETMVFERMDNVLKMGFDKIGIIEGPDYVSNAIDRQNGFFKALEKNNKKCHFAIKGDYDYDFGFDAMQKVLQNDCDLVFISNKEQLIGALRALNGSTKKIYIVAFDGIDYPWLMKENYSFIIQPIEEIGKRVAKLLIERLANPYMEIKNIVIRNNEENLYQHI